MVFLKWFDVDRQKMVGQGKVFVNKNWKIADLVPLIQERMKWDSVPVKLFEVSSDMEDTELSSCLHRRLNRA
jgi:ubiquitin carboxyl-terminal hydrolase 7